MAVAQSVLGVEIVAIDMIGGEGYVANVETRSAEYRANAEDVAALAAGLYADLQVALAGEISQQIAGYPRFAEGEAIDNDVAKVMNCALKLARLKAGLPAQFGPDEPREINPGHPLHTAALPIIGRAERETANLLLAHWQVVTRVAAVLDKSERLTQADIDNVMADDGPAS